MLASSLRSAVAATADLATAVPLHSLLFPPRHRRSAAFSVCSICRRRRPAPLNSKRRRQFWYFQHKQDGYQRRLDGCQVLSSGRWLQDFPPIPYIFNALRTLHYRFNWHMVNPDFWKAINKNCECSKLNSSFVPPLILCISSSVLLNVGIVCYFHTDSNSNT